MELIYVKLPRWKVYLYTLQQRIRLYKAVNINRHKWYLNRTEILLLRNTLKKYVPKEVIRKPKAYGYQYLLQSVLIDNVTVATVEEIELVQKLLIVNKLNLEELIMEMKLLKVFAKEVGIKDAEIKKMDEDTLIRTIITKVEPQQTYSKELVAFYDDLDDKYFDAAEATEQTTIAADEAKSKASEYPIGEVIEGIKEFTKVTELKEILADDDIGSLFDGFDPAPYKLAPKLKKAMIDFLENPPDEQPVTENENAEIIEAILELESEEDLVAAFEELQESHFSEVDVESVESEVQLKEAMLLALGYGETQPEPEKKSLLGKLKAKKEAAAGKTKLTATKTEDEFDWFDPEGDIEEQYAQVEALGFAKAKSFAKHKLGLTLKVGLKKDEIFDAIANKMQEMVEGGTGESTEEEETELTPELVNDAVKAKDKEALVAMCDQLEIKLNAIQKKGISGMQKKLLEALGETKTKVTPKGKQTKLKLGAKKEKVSEEKSVYQLMEELVIAGKSEDAITKAVSPYYKEKGKSILFIKKRVKSMIAIIKIDNDMEE
jgi:hypothetical protein